MGATFVNRVARDTGRSVEEVVRALDLGAAMRPYTRCLECNGRVQPLPRRRAALLVPLQVFLAFRDFTRCEACGRVYWPGSHQTRLERVIVRARDAARRSHAVGPEADRS